jgi:SAM-dependent methyltransferase
MVGKEKEIQVNNSLYAGRENARIYDLVYGLTETKDIPFWINMAEQVKPREILEIGVGTGRIAIPLAKAGFNVVGLDIEKSMLGVAKEKTAKLEKNVRKKLNFIEGDARNFDLNQQFDLITIPFNTFCHFLTKDDQVAVLKNIHKHLNPVKGVLVIDTFNSISKVAEEWDSSKDGKIPEDRSSFKQYIAIDTQREVVVRRLIRDYFDYAGGMKKLFIDRQSEVYRLRDLKLINENRSVFEAASLDIMSALDILPKAGFGKWKVVGDYDGHPSLDLMPLMIDMEIKGAPSEKIIIVTGPGMGQFEGEGLSPEKAEEIKNSRKNTGLELIVDGQELDPLMYRNYLNSLDKIISIGKKTRLNK